VDRLDASQQKLQVHSSVALPRIANIVSHVEHLLRECLSAALFPGVWRVYPGIHSVCQWALSSEERRGVIVKDLAAAAAVGDVHAAGACIQARLSLHPPRGVDFKMRF
jgi:hypothetical protein